MRDVNIASTGIWTVLGIQNVRNVDVSERKRRTTVAAQTEKNAEEPRPAPTGREELRVH